MRSLYQINRSAVQQQRRIYRTMFNQNNGYAMKFIPKNEDAPDTIPVAITIAKYPGDKLLIITLICDQALFEAMGLFIEVFMVANV